MKKTNTFKSIKGEAFEELMRKAEKNDSFIYPLAIAIAYSNLNKVIDPENKSAEERESVSNSGFNPRLMEARASIYPAVKTIENIVESEIASYVCKEEKTVTKKLNKKTGKIEISINPKAGKSKVVNPDSKDSFDPLIIGNTIDGIGLEIVNEIAIALLELKSKYGKRGGKWIEKDVVIRRPKSTVLHSKEAKIEYNETIVKPIQLAFRAGANYISAQRAVMNRISETVYLDSYEDDESLPPELAYVLKASSEYETIGDVERIEEYIGKMNLDKRETMILKWILDGMDCFAIDEETGKKRKIHVSNPSVELIAYRIGISEASVYRIKNAIQAKAEKIGLKPEKLNKLNESKAVEAINPKTGEIVAEYSSVNEGAREMKTRASMVSECIHGKRKTAGGYMWRRKILRTIPENDARYKI